MEESQELNYYKEHIKSSSKFNKGSLPGLIHFHPMKKESATVDIHKIERRSEMKKSKIKMYIKTKCKTKTSTQNMRRRNDNGNYTFSENVGNVKNEGLSGDKQHSCFHSTAFARFSFFNAIIQRQSRELNFPG